MISCLLLETTSSNSKCSLPCSVVSLIIRNDVNPNDFFLNLCEVVAYRRLFCSQVKKGQLTRKCSEKRGIKKKTKITAKTTM